MGVPFEALLPYGIVVAFFTVGATGLSYTKSFLNDGKKTRWNNDLWDRQMMERDLRLTGSLRGQINNPQAPKGFEVNKPWKVENRIF